MLQILEKVERNFPCSGHYFQLHDSNTKLPRDLQMEYLDLIFETIEFQNIPNEF